MATGHVPCGWNHHLQSRTGFLSCRRRRRGTCPYPALQLGCCATAQERSCCRKISSEGAMLRRHGAIQASSQMLLQSKLSIILLFCSEGSGSDWQFVALSSLHFPTIYKKQILLHSAGSQSVPGTCHLHCNEHSDCRHLLLLNVEFPEHFSPSL